MMTGVETRIEIEAASVRLAGRGDVTLAPMSHRAWAPMNAPARRFSLLLLASVALTACPAKPPQSPPRSKLPQPEMLADTPEHALASYWAYLDWYQSWRDPRTGSILTGGPTEPLGQLLQPIVTGDVAASFSRMLPPTEPLLRTLESLERADDQSAVMICRIRLDTAQVARITPTPIELFDNDSVGRFRYHLVHDQQWKVAEVWRLGEAGQAPRRIR